MNPGNGEDPKSILKQIRTFQGDAAEALRRQNESLVSIQRAEAAKTEVRAKEAGKKSPLSPEAKERRKNLAMAFGSFLLVALGIIGGWYAYAEFRAKTAIQNVPPPQSRLVSATHTISVQATKLSRGALLSAILEARNRELSSSEALHINLRDTQLVSTDPEVAPADIDLTTEKFLKTLESRAPGNLIRALEPIFMLGVLGGESQSVFIIMRISSFENAFGGMLNWEKNMAKDLGPLMATADAIGELPETSAFEDVTTRNKDARVLRGFDRKPLLLYSFYDNNTLVITDSLESLRTLISRLNNALLTR